ncbi:MAG: type VI secretion system protein TssA [Planctomycetes bacterium]|nr:type VI secretion system protein TssA [Planctomycetota bacterium]
MTDLTKLLAAIQPDAPGGADLRRDSTTTLFARLRELRRRDDPATVAQGVEPKEADFQAVAEVCSEALATSTKDLELAAYLTEAWAATRGLAGLADGLALVKALLEGFWPHLQPGLERENGTVEIVAPVRAKWLGWLAGAHEFLTTVRSVELTDDGRSLLDYEAAQRMQEKQRVDLPTYEKMLAEGYVTPEQWAKSVAASGARLTGEIAAAQRCLDELGGLEQASRTCLADDSPSFADLRELLERIVGIGRGLESGGGGGDPAAVGNQGGGGPGSTSPAAGGGAPGEIRTRDDAMATLRKVAVFLRRTEPHSPVSFLVERCVRWLNMSFEEVAADLVESDSTMGTIRKTLGLPTPDEES